VNVRRASRFRGSGGGLYPAHSAAALARRRYAARLLAEGFVANAFRAITLVEAAGTARRTGYDP
jgi:hypothetical protein